MKPTPRTDALVQGGVIACNLLEHAREMEREADDHKRYAMSIENDLFPTQDVARWYQEEFGIANARAKKAEEEVESLREELQKIRLASQAVVDRWETPLWKDAEPTASVIYRLRDAIAPAPEEPVIQDSRITEPEWRELGPDEVICEGDEVQPKHHIGGEWVKAWSFELGVKSGHFKAMRYRTHRPLPKLEKMPLEKMLECFLADYPDAGKAIYDAIYNLRDEIEKLKNK